MNQTEINAQIKNFETLLTERKAQAWDMIRAFEQLQKAMQANQNQINELEGALHNARQQKPDSSPQEGAGIAELDRAPELDTSTAQEVSKAPRARRHA